VLSPFVALLWPLRQHQTVTIEDDELPAEAMTGESQGGPTMFIRAKAEPPSPTSSRAEPKQRVGSAITFPSEAGAVVSAVIGRGTNLTVLGGLNNGREERLQLDRFGPTQPAVRVFKLDDDEKISWAQFQHDDSHAAGLAQMGRDHEWPDTRLLSDA
jgi:hypothetical protein